MMESIIYLFILIIFIISLIATNQTATKPNKNILLGITLPRSFLENSCVTEIVSRYKRAYKVLIFIGVVFSIPLLIETRYPSFSIIYMLLWILLVLYFNNKIFIKYHGELYKLKKENNWFTGPPHIVTIDTEVSRIKSKMPVSKLWFIPSFIVSIVPLFITLNKANHYETTQIILSLIPFLLILIFIYLYKLTASEKTVVYSENTDINIACNYIHKRLWSICWIINATITSIASAVFYLNLSDKKYSELVLALSGVLPSLISLLVIIYTHKKINETKNRLLEASDKLVYADEDEYWKNGYYYNPKDNRTMVEKRIGYGFTFNMARTKGKLISYGVIGSAIILVLFLSVMFVRFDTSEFKLSIDGNMVKIDAPVYRYSFNISDIKEIKKVDKVPRGIRTNGVSTSRYNLGDYNLNNYGKSKMYIYKENPPYIVIKLENIYVFINGKTRDITEQYYNLLLNNVKGTYK
ncbi:hypothetical protein Q428_13990 [Fervidicella metallireducens AeB]|uniref:Bacterial Pleckstrin homology domain-containing protein n=1 Tax=Fervidicella metallireducens AeB TaxID=1403537 RepID=A0A017RS68_9CLOT|nr:PH domain-containing protein [Fervidicella metallireducens]EYE87314.1 hypothetical protein Q428_13990 [Fervidicella metallireducens AeB]